NLDDHMNRHSTDMTTVPNVHSRGVPRCPAVIPQSSCKAVPVEPSHERNAAVIQYDVRPATLHSHNRVRWSEKSGRPGSHPGAGIRCAIEPSRKSSPRDPHSAGNPALKP